MSSQAESSPPPPKPAEDGLLQDSNYVNSMIHFYRGELGRIMVWRQRLDVTTTWAITSTSTIITIAFSVREIPHIVFFFNLAIVWMMLWIEARRYRFYDAFRGRVRMLESHFLVPMLMRKQKLLDGEWRRLVSEDLILPSFKISKLEAVGRRLKRNYGFIFAIILVAWTLKVFIHSPHTIHSLADFYAALAVYELPAWLAALVFFGTAALVLGLVAFVARRSSEEVSEFGAGQSSLWRA